MEKICEYGCGRPAIKLFKSRKWGCSVSPNSCPGVKSKKKQTLMDIYGVTNVSQIEEIQQKKKNTWIEKYGVDNPSKAQINIDKIKAAWPETYIKRKETMYEKYGVDSYSKTEEFQLRRKETWIEKYGVDNPVKNADILHKVVMANSKSEYRTKSMTLPSGNIIQYQGYENIVINELLESGLTEEEIVTGPANVPHIIYEYEGKKHRYYPDIYIPKLNLIIEVKSTYTWNKYKEKNLAKQAACKEAGFNFKLEIRSLRKT